MASFLEISSEQIQRLDEHLLVELLRRLVKAEMLKNGIPLRDMNVPTQIHIPDGGEDGRVSWSGGVPAVSPPDTTKPQKATSGL